MTGLLVRLLSVPSVSLRCAPWNCREKFKVEVDEKEVLVRAELPGNNCGGCGFRAATVWRLPLLQAQLRLMAVRSVELQLQTRLQRSWVFQAEQVSRRLPLSNVKAPAIRAA